jgi:hypothetical protein
MTSSGNRGVVGEGLTLQAWELRRRPMKTLLAIVALAGAIVLADTAAEQWAGANLAIAQGRNSSACYQNCTNVRRWPSAQCRQYCRGKAKKGM